MKAITTDYTPDRYTIKHWLLKKYQVGIPESKRLKFIIYKSKQTKWDEPLDAVGLA